MAQDILSSLKPAAGATKKPKRIGRGQGSGHGKTATRGEKGAGSRAGSKSRAWFEGGQMPLSRRVPKRGFHSPFKVMYQVVNVETLERLATDGKLQDGSVNPEVLAKLGVVRSKRTPLKVLGSGDVKTKLNVAAHAFSASAVQKIQAAGGTTQTISSTSKE